MCILTVYEVLQSTSWVLRVFIQYEITIKIYTVFKPEKPKTWRRYIRDRVFYQTSTVYVLSIVIFFDWELMTFLVEKVSVTLDPMETLRESTGPRQDR